MPTQSSSGAFTTNIRSELQKRGVPHNQIGFSPQTNSYTVDKTPFMKSNKNYSGAGYTSPQNFASAWNSFKSGKPTLLSNSTQPQQEAQGYASNQQPGYNPSQHSAGGYTANQQPTQGYNQSGVTSHPQYDPTYGMTPKTGNTMPAGTQAGTAPNYSGTPATQSNLGGMSPNGAVIGNNQYNPYNYATGLNGQNPYTSQFDKNLQTVIDFAMNPQFTDPYSTPEYAAYAAQSGRRANEGTRAAQEAYGSAGFGRSYGLGERAQGIQNAETEYLDTQVIPQIIAAEQARRQQQFNNMMSSLNPLQGQQSRADQQVQQDFNNAITKGQLLGSFNDPAATNLYNTVTQSKQAYADAAARGDRAGMKAANDQANAARSQLQNMGYDTSGYSANTTLDTALHNNPSIRTLGGQQQDLNEKQFNFNAANEVGDRAGVILSPQNDTNGLYRQLETGQTSAGTDVQQSLGGRQQDVSEAQAQSSLTSEQQARELNVRAAALQEWQTNGFATKNVATILGVPENTPTSDQAYRDASVQLDQDKLTFSEMQAKADAQNQQQKAPDTITASAAGDLLTGALKKQIGVDKNTGKPVYGSITDPNTREDIFVDLYNTTGIRGADMVTALAKAGYSTKEIAALQKAHPEVFQ